MYLFLCGFFDCGMVQRYHRIDAMQPFAHFAQNDFANFSNFVHTYRQHRGIIIFVKTPQYIIYFYYPHSKIPSPKKTADRKAVFFFMQQTICATIIYKFPNRKDTT